MLYWGLTAEGWKWNKLFDCSEPNKNKKFSMKFTYIYVMIAKLLILSEKPKILI